MAAAAATVPARAKEEMKTILIVSRCKGSVVSKNFLSFWETVSGRGVAAGVEVRQAVSQSAGIVHDLRDTNQGVLCLLAVSLPSDKLSSDCV